MMPLLADVGVPMLCVEGPAMVLAILPVIFIEAMILARTFRLRFWYATRVSATANLVSAVVGIPLAWAMMLIVELLTGGGRAYGLETASKKVVAVTLQAAWLIPYEHDLHWMIPSATIVLLVPTFLVSVWIERPIVAAMLRMHVQQAVRPAVWRANATSYGFLFLLTAAWLVASLVSPPTPR